MDLTIYAEREWLEEIENEHEEFGRLCAEWLERGGLTPLD